MAVKKRTQRLASLSGSRVRGPCAPGGSSLYFITKDSANCKATAGTLQKTLPMKGKVISSVGPYLLCKFQRLPWSCFPLISYFMFFKFPQGGKHSSVVNKINVLMKAHGGGVCNWTSCLPSQCTGPSLLTFIPLLLSCKDLLEPVCSLDYPVNITCSFLPIPFSHCSSCLEHN